MKMKNFKKPFILISNDDGYHANGIKTLVRILSGVADLLVCAPEAARSGFPVLSRPPHRCVSSAATTWEMWKCGHATAHRLIV